jgi:hypothetical protein
MGLDTITYLLTDRQSQCDFDFGIHFKYKRLKLGGRQAYDRSSEEAAVVA